MPGMNDGDEVGLREASALLGLHYMTVYRYVRTGRLAARREGGDWLVRRDDLAALAGDQAAPAERGRRGSPRHGPRVGRLVSTLLAGDEAGAWTVISEALAAGATAGTVGVDLIGAAMRRIGERWESGSASVADEHRASVIAHRLIGRVGAHAGRRGRHRGTIVLGAPAGEMHSLPSALLADVLREQGYEVHDLGANVPTDDFVAFVAGLEQVWAVGVVVTTSPPSRTLVPLIKELRRRAGVPVVVGGAAAVGAELRLPAGVLVSQSTDDAAALLGAGSGRGAHAANQDAGMQGEPAR
jgi:excisionase family DNA binding protein